MKFAFKECHSFKTESLREARLTEAKTSPCPSPNTPPLALTRAVLGLPSFPPQAEIPTFPTDRWCSKSAIRYLWFLDAKILYIPLPFLTHSTPSLEPSGGQERAKILLSATKCAPRHRFPHAISERATRLGASRQKQKVSQLSISAAVSAIKCEIPVTEVVPVATRRSLVGRAGLASLSRLSRGNKKQNHTNSLILGAGILWKKKKKTTVENILGKGRMQ